MAESRYIRLTDYCLIEYIFSSVGTPLVTSTFRMVYNTESGVNQIYNDNADDLVTGNIQDKTAVPIGNNKYVYIDEEKVPPYVSYDPTLVATDINGGVPFPFLPDTVRFHFQSGFTFEEFEALVLSVKNKKNDGTYGLFASLYVSILTIDTMLTFNPRPLFLTDIMYDRYIEIKIPAIRELNQAYYSTTGAVQANTLAARITTTLDNKYTGFEDSAPIVFSIDESTKTERLKTDDTVYDIQIVENHKEASLPQVSEFDLLGVYIAESAEGDYVEYYATYDGGFIADFIGRLSARNPHDKWVLVHQFNIFEQVGSSFINTAKKMDYQDSDFDEAQTMRPVLKYANTALSFSIDYTMILMNQLDGEQIIRSGSFSSLNPKKYGKYLSKIPLASLPQSHKIYNRLFKKNFEASNLFVEPSLESSETDFSVTSDVSVVTQTVYVPVFFNFSRINIGFRNMSVKEEDTFTDLIYKQTDLRVLFQPFDNIFKFKIYEVINEKLVPMNLSFNSKFNMVFMNGSNKVRFANAQDPAKENPEVGEIVFTVPQSSSEIILNSDTRDFYITVPAEDGTETVLYTGFWNSIDELDIIRENNQRVKDEQDASNAATKKIEDLESVIAQQSVDLQNVADVSANIAIPNNTKIIAVTAETKPEETVPVSAKIDIPGYVARASGKSEVSVVKKIKPLRNRKATTVRTSTDDIAQRSLRSSLG